MSLTSIINIATSGVLAQQRAIGATSENIANLTTPNFARREVSFRADPVISQLSGVQAQIARDAGNSFLQSAFAAATSDSASLETRSAALNRIVSTLGEFGDDLSFADRASAATAAFARLGANPASPAARAEALSALDQTLSAFGRTRSAINFETQQASQRLDTDIVEANDILARIRRLNQQLGNGQSPGGIADQLSAEVSTLGTLINITVSRDDLGRAILTGPGGVALADAAGAARLSRTDGPTPQILVSPVSTTPATPPENGDGGTTDITSFIAGGSIGGALSLLTDDLPALQTLIDGAETNFVSALNGAVAGNVSIPAGDLVGTLALTDADIAGFSGTSVLAVLGTDGQLLNTLLIDFSTNQLSFDGGAPVAFTPTLDGLSSAINGTSGGALAVSISGEAVSFAAAGGAGVAIANDSAGLAARAGFNPLIVADGQTATGLRVVPENLRLGRLDLAGATIGSVVTGTDDGRGANALFAAGRGEATSLANALGSIGAAANAIGDDAAIAAALTQSLEVQNLSENGINLEEVLSNLILFQQAFNANARVIAAADELYESILALI
ncbi:MAG: flagellar basal body rod C-terminal domain-containing protein [Pseudomonadota bacterium]